MSLPTPNLDDRTWQDIVEEAKKLIPAFCPQWTDFNPSDPGLTLVELMAWMTEMIIYRLNRVPDKNYIKFMELMGIRLKTPRPAATWMVFHPAEGTEEELMPVVPANTKVSSYDTRGDTVIFETIEPMNLNHSRLTAVVARINERYLDSTDYIVDNHTAPPIDLFTVTDQIPHALYLSDPDLAKAGSDYHFCILTSLDLVINPLHTTWSYWDGQDWRKVDTIKDETVGFSKSGAIKFPEMKEIMEMEFQGHTGFWLRVELTEYAGSPLPQFEQFKKFMEIKREAGIMPETGFVTTKDAPFMPVIFEAPFMPFGREANIGDTLYIGSNIFADKDEPVTLQIVLAKTYRPLPPEEMEQLSISWEYYNEKGEWQMLGISAPTGTLQSSHAFIDRTEAFTHSGPVSFHIPHDIAPMEAGGEITHWIRITVKEGNYGDKKKLNPPVCDHILIQYKDTPANFQHYITYNDFKYLYITPFQEPHQLFEPFIPVNRENPELYLGFDRRFSNKPHGIYFPLEGNNETGPPQRWEYYHHDGWKVLNLVEDQTGNLTGRGLVKLMGPPEWQPSTHFGHGPAYWLRIRWQGEPGPYLPRLRSIHLNAVKAINAESHKNEILGSGNGQPYQRLAFTLAPILPGPRIMVKELDSSIQEEIRKFKEHVHQEIVEETDTETGEVIALWVVWEEQENFFKSKRGDRHYILDVEKGEITFGDGIMGKIPPIGSQNIKCQVYYTGGGTGGNLAPKTITNLDDSIPFIDRVTNPYQAVGGTDKEMLEQAKLRAPWELKHRHRAVTREDFERFALDATGEVACVQVRPDEQGIVNIMIVPHGHENDGGKPEAAEELCRTVKQYIDRHRLITTKIKVSGPTYVDFTLQAEVVLLRQHSHLATQKRQEIAEALRGFFHPLTGDINGTGYQIGRSAHLSELYYLIEDVPGVDYVSRLVLDNKPEKRKINIPDHSFPYPKEITITFVSA
jgi:hypothetical protein